MYIKEKIAIEMDGELATIWVKISQDFILEVNEKKYKAICIIKSDTKNGNILFWTQESINKAITNAVKISLAKISMREKFLDDNENTQLALYRSTKFDEGDFIKHSYFGFGKVIKIDSKDENMLVTVLFENGEIKRLISKFANLQIVCNKDGNHIA